MTKSENRDNGRATPSDENTSTTAARTFFIPADQLGDGTESSGVEWLEFLGIRYLVGRGLFTLISARPKAGKTTLMAHAVQDWLRLKYKVAWLSEESRGVWRERVKVVNVSDPELRLGFINGADINDWCAALRGLRPDAIIVDTGRSFLGVEDENDSAAVYRRLIPLVLTARELDAALVILHHRRKSDGDEGTDHAGSHAWVGACDVAISIKEDGASPRRRDASVRSRFDDSPSRLTFELNSNRTYTAKNTGDDPPVESIEYRVQRVLTDKFRTTMEIVESLPEPRPGREMVRQALLKLADDKTAKRATGSGKRGDLWALAAAFEDSYVDDAVAAEGDDDWSAS